MTMVLDFATSFLTAKWRQRLPKCVLILSLLLMLYALWGLTDAIREMYEIHPIPNFTQDKVVVAQELPDLSSFHLFGVAEQKQIDIPESRANFQLKGLFLKDNLDQSSAVISSSGEDKVYQVGDSLPGGVKIYKITPQGVVLERGGKFERLDMPREI